MNLTRLFITRPTLVFVLVALIFFAGILSITKLVQQLFPNVSQPTVTINVSYNGASTAEMRDNIVAPIEQNLAGTTDLQTMNSTIQQGQATISAIFVLGSQIATDLTLTQKAVQDSEKVLPTNLTPPTVSIRDPSESTVVTLFVSTTTLSAGQLSLYVDNVIVPRIEQIPGVSYASVGGDVTPAYEVQVDPLKLAAANLTLNDVIGSVSTQNARVPGGIVYEPNRETTLDIRGDIQDPQTVAGLPIVVAGQPAAAGTTPLAGTVDPWTAGSAIYRVGDVATVAPGNEPRRQYAQINNRPGMFLSVQKTGDASEVTSSGAVLQELPTLRRQFPEVDFSVVNTQSKYTQQQIANVTHTLLEGIFLTGIAMIFFLRSWRSAVVVCIAIPTSLAIALTCMKIFGLTIDTISLLGMTLVIGILVDDSTVVLENIERHHRELKQPPKKAALDGRTEIGAAAVVITLVDVVVFLPIAFLPGQVGAQLQEFAVVVVISTLTSLFISFTVTPTLAGLWALREEWRAPKIVDWFTRAFNGLRDWYAHKALPLALDRGSAVALLCALSFVAAVAMVPLGLVGEEFVPNTDRGQLYIQLTFPLGTPLAEVRTGAFKLEHLVDEQKDVDADTTVAGAYSAAFGGFVLQGNVAQTTIFLKDGRKHSTDYWVGQFRAMARETAPDASAVVVPSTGTTGGNKQPIDYLVTDVSGADPTAAAAKVLDILRNTPGAISANSSGTLLAPQVSVNFDRLKAQELDVDIGSAAEAAGAAFGGAVATQFETAQGLEQVQIIYPLAFQHELESLASIPNRAENGSIVHLGDFATFKSDPTSPLITRTDRNTVIHVDANMAPGYSLSTLQAAFTKRLARAQLGRDIVVRPAPLGQQDFMAQTLRGLGQSLILSVVLAFLLMVALYNDYRSPFIILFSVPVAAVGAIGALMLTHKTLNLFSLIGTILLVGIATKNGILLVDYANTLRRRGKEKAAAIRESAHTRFRPIVMTSISVVAGNLPLALALEPGSSARASLGIVVIGGVMSSLILTLLLVPIVYMWLAPKELPDTSMDEELDGAHDGNGHAGPLELPAHAGAARA
jgi:HAE1 family hydrophobic/amphiphilic exporter-1